MASRRDELQAHQFLKQRVVSALIVHQTDPERPPFRRAAVSGFGSLALALLALAVVGVYGLIVPVHGKAFKPGKEVIVEKETGNRFVYLNGRLNPVSNYSSALLILGKHTGTQLVSRNALVGLPRGPLVGIAGAPDELPDSKHLLGAPWTMCAQPGTNNAGGRTNKSVLLIGRGADGGSAVGDRATLLNVPSTGQEYLLWHGYRHEIADQRAVSAGLALADESRIDVAAAWVDVLPAGPSIRPLSVPYAGYRSSALPSRPETRIGQLFVVRVSSTVSQYYLAQERRLVPISPFQFYIQLAAKVTRLAYPGESAHAIGLDPAEVTLAGQAPDSTNRADPPRVRPAFVQPTSSTAAVCAAFTAGNPVPTISVGAAVPASGQTTPGHSPAGAPLADRIVVPPGRAALVSVVPNSSAAAGTISLITDLGIRYAVPSTDVLKTLGYDGVKPIRVPADLAARIPEGPALDPAIARRPH